MKFHPLHQAAREYAQRGIPVFPCEPNTKQPRAGGHGFHDATTDLAQIDAWWSEKPYNPATCPHMSGWGVVDLDGPEAVNAWELLQIEHGFADETFTVQTPRGPDHLHLYFKGELPASQGTATAGLAPHIDTRGMGSYALLPPSTTPDGEYRVRDASPAAAIPEWVAEVISSKRRAAFRAAVETPDLPGNVARARRYLEDRVRAGDVAVEGQMGDNKTFATACEVMNLGISQEKALDLLLELWNPHCTPPWDADELATKVANAAQYAQNEAGAWASPPAADAFGSVLDTLGLIGEPQEERSFKRFRPKTLEEIATMPPPSWLIKDVIPDHGVTLFYGNQGSYKSFIVLQHCLELAAEGTPVVYVAGEGERGMEIRASAWKLAHEIDRPIPLYLVGDMPWASDGEMSMEFIEAIKEAKPRLVVIDTVARAMVGLNENDAKDMGLFVAFADTIKNLLGCAVAVIHHTPKDGSSPRGSNALPAAVDAAHEIKANKDVLAVAMQCVRMKDAAEREEPWTWEGHAFASSLVFQPVTVREYRQLMAQEDNLAPKRVGATLARLGAFGEENGIETPVLAAELADIDVSSSPEAMIAARARVAKVLGARSKDVLEPYAYGSGRDRRWYLPAKA